MSHETVNARDVPWRPSPAAPRVHLKDLGHAGGCFMQLVRYEAGGALAIEGGGASLCLYVLEGELIHRGRRLWPGSTAVIPAGGEEAGESHTEVGCVFLLVRWGGAPARP